MISSRWPRPIGMRASTALMPVWTGVSTDWRVITPGRSARPVGSWCAGCRPCVQRVAEGIHDTAEEGLADRDLDDVAGGPDLVAFLDRRGVAEDHGAPTVSS